ncbi:hypothetical protein Tco_1469438, partial [Tanacetum coccineum]
AAIRQLITDGIAIALEAQAANMANTDNNTRPRKALVELATLCPTMVPDSKKMMEVFIGRLLEVTKHTPVQVSSNPNESLTKKELSTTTTTTATPTTATIITNHNRTEDRKPSGLMLPPQLKTIERKGIMQISAERPPTTMPREKPTC